jgi:hypothetical protein
LFFSFHVWIVQITFSARTCKVLFNLTNPVIWIHLEVQVTSKAAVEMSALSKDLVLLISQFLDEEGFKETARMYVTFSFSIRLF